MDIVGYKKALTRLACYSYSSLSGTHDIGGMCQEVGQTILELEVIYGH
jgi:hypothetical protein